MFSRLNISLFYLTLDSKLDSSVAVEKSRVILIAVLCMWPVLSPLRLLRSSPYLE